MLKAKRAILLLLFVVFSGSVARGSAVASTTVLTTSPGSPVSAGTAVTLSAAVTANSSAVTTGQVLFCVATAVRCTDANLFGTAQLTATGTASLKMTLGAGTYSIVAKFLGVPGINPSTSSAQPLLVTSDSNYFSYTTLSPSGSAGDYTLTATVLAGGRNRPTGTVSFVDQTNSNSVVATAPLSAGSLFYGFLPQGPALSPGSYPQGTVAGDFNGDGISDLAVVNQGNNTIAVYLGVGNGTFEGPTTYNVGDAPMQIVAGDFNGDGALDLAVTNYDDGTVGVLLNNGNGTFGSMIPYFVDGLPNGLVVGDFNNDGLLDIAVTIDPDSDVVILRGMGAGSFCLTEEWFEVGNEGSAIAAADFNHDGDLDLAVVNEEDNTVSVLLGNGNLTFATQATFSTGSSPYGIAVGDFNEDGNPDIAVANAGDGTISLFAGNGAGGFTALPPIGVDGDLYAIAAADFNQDGHLDLVVTNIAGGNAQIFSGNGDGGFSFSGTYNTGYLSFNEVVADWNGDGLPDLAVVNAGDDAGPNTVSIFLGEQTETATATNVSVTGAGNHTVAAQYPGDADRLPSVSSGATLQGIVATTTTLAGSPNPSTYGQSVTLTATVTPAPTGEILGTVSFYNGEVLVASANVNSSGIATLATTSLPVGTLTLTATYNGTSDGYATSTSSPLTFVVNQASTATAINSVSPTSPVAGQSTTFTATVTPAPTGSPLGTVSFYNGVTLIGSGNVNSSGVATLTTGSLTAGTLNLTAVYSGNTNFSGSNSSAQNVAVLFVTTTALTPSPSPATYGQSVTLTAVVSPTPTGSPLGMMSFFSGATLLGTNTVDVTGTATFSLSSLPVGVANLTAVYSGNAAFNASTSSVQNLTINTVPTATVLTGTPNPVTFGQSVTLTATLAPAPAGSPLGSVNFYNGEVLLGTGNVNAAGVATLSTATLPVGTLSLNAVYSGNTDFAGSTSTALSFVVNQITTATALAVSPNPVVAGASETLTATVTPAPTGESLGTVAFYNGETLVGTGNVNSSGVATATSTTLPAGVLSLTAVYSGNTDFAGSTSPAQGLTVLQATATVLTGSPNPSTFGQAVTLTATVTPAPTGPSLGTITFMNGSTQIGTGNINASGVATLTTSSLAVSTYSLTAVYSGNAAFNTSTSSVLSLVVNLAPTATVITASPSPAAFGQSVTLTATITPAPTGGSLGVVSFFNGATAVGSGPVNSSGIAMITTAVLPVGSLSLTGVYGGNAGFAGSTSSVVTLVVNALPTATALAVSPNPVVTGQTETLTATITPVPTATPYGTVNFFNGATQIGTGNVNASGVATMTTSSLAAGTPSLTAAYSGNTDYVASTSTAQSLTVLAATATVLTGSPNPSTYAQSVTFTATVTPAPTGSSLGTVSFLSGATQLGTANINSYGVATLTTNSLTVAAYSLTAVYSGNVGFSTSTSNALSLTVNLAPTTTVLTSSPSPATYGQSVTLTATVTPAPTGTTLGTVTFFNGETQLGTGTVSGGTATFTSTILPAGALSLTAVYSGNANFAGSTATAVSLTVNTTYTVTVPPTVYDVAQGGSVSINVTVPPIGGAYNSVVTMSASGLPPGATATFVPPTVTPGTTGAPTTLTIQLAPLASQLVKPNSGGSRMEWRLSVLFNPAYGSALAALLATLMLFVLPRRRRMAKTLQFAAFIAVACLLGSALTGCSGGFLRPPSTQPGSFTVTVTGTSGSVHQSTTVTVVVQ